MLIIDMPMPKTCVECPMSNYKSKPCMRRDQPRTSLEMHLAYMDEKRPSWCPIKGELVRCGECRYFTETDEVHGIKAGKCMWWQIRHMPEHGLMRADHYCADGERKDGEE